MLYSSVNYPDVTLDDLIAAEREVRESLNALDRLRKQALDALFEQIPPRLAHAYDIDLVVERSTDQGYWLKAIATPKALVYGISLA